ncbi:transposable element Tcb2 transposase [Trichonephila clavipes]|nr:transposable element Tcb2 transposase [Trichonephila clavipes]
MNINGPMFSLLISLTGDSKRHLEGVRNTKFPRTLWNVTVSVVEVMVWGIMIDGRTPLHVFRSGSVIGQIYRDEVLDPYVRLFRGAYDVTFYLWMIMLIHIEQTRMNSLVKTLQTLLENMEEEPLHVNPPPINGLKRVEFNSPCD